MSGAAKRRVVLGGATGWVGRPLAAAIAAADDLELVAAVARTPGADVEGAPRFPDVGAALAVASDVYVDYTSAAAAQEHVLRAIAARRHVVVGSSGLDTEAYRDIDARARAAGVGVIAVGNFALPALLLQRFAVEAAQHLEAWEMVDRADAGKRDAPSGTARELAWRLSLVRPPVERIGSAGLLGPPEVRGALVDGTRVHAVRLPGQGLGVDVHFGHGDQRLTLTYEGGASAESYVAGTLRAIRRVSQHVGLVRGADAVW